MRQLGQTVIKRHDGVIVWTNTEIIFPSTSEVQCLTCRKYVYTELLITTRTSADRYESATCEHVDL